MTDGDASATLRRTVLESSPEATEPSSESMTENGESKPTAPAPKPNASSWRVYWQALRPWSFTASVTPVLLGVALAYRVTGGYWNGLIFFTSGLTALSVHAAGNLVNTYFDFSMGVDTSRHGCDDRTLVDELLTPTQVEQMATLLYALGTAAFVATVILTGGRAAFVLTLIFVLGMSGSFFYTGGGSLAFKYKALGELLVFTVFGPVSVAFSFFAQLANSAATDELARWVWPPLLYALPLAINTVAILHANNMRDATHDRSRPGVVTVAILLGPTLSRLLLAVLILLPYVICAVLAMHSAVTFLLPMLSALDAVGLVRDVLRKHRRQEAVLYGIPQRIARQNLTIGILYIFSILLAPAVLFHEVA